MNEEDKNNINSENEEVSSVQDTEIEKLKMDRDEYLAGWQRTKADFINYRKDEMKRMEELAKYGQENLMRELITIMDNFDLGLSAMEKDGKVEKGVYMIRAQMHDILKKYGLEKVEIKMGEPFDPAMAEAIAEMDPPVGSDWPPGSVAEEIEPGYLLFDKLIRPARVRVVKSKE